MEYNYFPRLMFQGRVSLLQSFVVSVICVDPKYIKGTKEKTMSQSPYWLSLVLRIRKNR